MRAVGTIAILDTIVPTDTGTGGLMARMRKKMGRKKSRRDFRKKADRIHKKNVDAGPRHTMRGGIRL